MVQQNSSSVRVVGCFLWEEGKFLILKRSDSERESGKWGLPAGKVKNYETDAEAMVRELHEETGYLTHKDKVEYLGEWTWQFPDKLLTFPTFSHNLKEPIKVKVNPVEHVGHRWVTPEECYSRKDLIHGFHDLLELVGYIEK